MKTTDGNDLHLDHVNIAGRRAGVRHGRASIILGDYGPRLRSPRCHRASGDRVRVRGKLVQRGGARGRGRQHSYQDNHDNKQPRSRHDPVEMRDLQRERGRFVRGGRHRGEELRPKIEERRFGLRNDGILSSED